MLSTDYRGLKPSMGRANECSGNFTPNLLRDWQTSRYALIISAIYYSNMVVFIEVSTQLSQL